MCLLSCGAYELPVGLSQICKYSHTKIIKNSSVHTKLLHSNETCKLIMKSTDNYIVIDDSIPISTQRYMISCKLGYVYIGFNIPEYKAEHFAANLLAPICVLSKMNIYNWNTIAHTCNIPKTVARYQLSQLSDYRTHELSQIECLLCKRFRKFLNMYNTNQ